jgi:hypothetical protein
MYVRFYVIANSIGWSSSLRKTAFPVAISQHVDDREQTYQPQDSQLRTRAHDWMMLYQRYVSGNKKYFLGNMSGKFV